MLKDINLPPTHENICAIVITYFPDDLFPERIKCIAKQVNKVVIVDNKSSEYCLDIIKKVSSLLGTHLILNKDNLGVATAFNIGIQYARNIGCQWVLTLDQDTFPNHNFVENLVQSYYNCPFKDNIGIIGSNYKENNANITAYDQNKFNNNSWIEVNEVITSGSLISISVINDVGFFRDGFFIYYIDHEYCIRLRMLGYKVIVSRNIGMVHSTGNCEIKRILWKKIVVFNYIPLMNYYIVRNGLILVREYICKDAFWAVYRMYVLIRRIISTIIFCKDRLKALYYILLGTYHAIILKEGKLKY